MYVSWNIEGPSPIRGVGRKLQVVRPMGRHHACGDHACKPVIDTEGGGGGGGKSPPPS